MILERRWAWAGILLAFLLLATTGLEWGLPSTRSWSNDDISPHVPMDAMRNFQSGTHKYPYLQPLIDRALYEPYLRGLTARGEMEAGCDRRLADCFVHPALGLSGLMRISRWRSLCMAAIAILATGWTAGTLFGTPAAVAAGLLAAVNETLVFYAKLGNLDAPSAMWFMLSMAAYIQVMRRGRKGDWLVFGLTSGLALATKEVVVGAYVLAVPAMAWEHVRRESYATTPGTANWDLLKPIGLMAVALVGTYLSIQNAVFNGAGFVAHLRHWLGGPGVEDFNDSYNGPLWLLGRLGEASVDGAGWPMVLLMSVASLRGILSKNDSHRRRATTWLLVPALSFLLFSIVPVGIVNTRFLLPLYLLLSIVASPLVLEMWTGSPMVIRKRPTATPRLQRLPGPVLLLCVITYSALFSLNASLAMNADTRLAAESWMRGHLPAGASVVGFGSDIYLPRLVGLRADLDATYIHWKDLPPYLDGDNASSRLDPEELALSQLLLNADGDLSGLPTSAPEWLVLSARGGPPKGSAGDRLWSRIKAGDTAYFLQWDSDRAYPGMARYSGRPSPLGAWLPGAVVESRVSPRLWILRRRTMDSQQR